MFGDGPGKCSLALSKSVVTDRIPTVRTAGAHHEKLDGSGYPDNLHAEALSLEARILTVADIYGAMIEDRPYRKGFSAEKALAIMEQEAGSKIDGDCFAALASVSDTIQPSVEPLCGSDSCAA